MPQIYFLQNWFNLSDPAVEELLYDMRVMREFVDIDLGKETAPTTKSIDRACIEHPFLIGKRVFGFTKACYRGLKKNAARAYTTFTLINPYCCRKKLRRLLVG